MATSPIESKKFRSEDPVKERLIQESQRDEPNEATRISSGRDFAITEKSASQKVSEWKPPINVSYETVVCCNTENNEKLRPAGFRADGKHRQIKSTCMMAKVRARCMVRKQNPKMAVCVTMYNEDEQELKNTLRGLIQNYNALKKNPKTNFSKDDFVVCLICDGYENMPESFKQFARDKKFLDEEILVQNGFMDLDRDKKFRMRNLLDIMGEEVPKDKVPQNMLHIFQVTSWDFGIEQEVLQGRRINFMFAIKHRNDGKINSHKMFYQAVCKFLKPQFTLMLDIGTRPDSYAIQKLYTVLINKPHVGGVCGEIEVEIQPNSNFFSYIIQVAQFFEYKLGHTPDKACEAFFGFSLVLPGAYSFFRWEAIKGAPLDAFFKNVTSQEVPTCLQANEYLAEDRIMCLQIYIKRHTGYTVQFIPEAKAFTDAPQNLFILMKQRRRWMNGGFFGTWRVLVNVHHVLSCRRNSHPWWRQIGMFLFLFYMTTLYLLQFLTVSAIYITIILFFDQIGNIYMTSSDSEFVRNLYNSGALIAILFYSYLACLLISIFVSISMPLDRAMYYFKPISIIMGILQTVSLVGVASFLAIRGVHPPVLIRECPDPDSDNNCVYVEDPSGATYFSVLTVAGSLMFTIYFVPFVLRPLDFLYNFHRYVIGLLCYLLMMPYYANIFLLYSICNLHDVSWGNRPANTGGNTVSVHKKDQEKAKADYMVFRSNFVFFWIVVAFGYYIMIDAASQQNENRDVIDTDQGYLEGFALYLAALAIFRFVFGSLYLLKWKWNYNLNPTYKNFTIDLKKEYAQIRKEAEDSTDDEKIETELNKIFDKNKDKIRETNVVSKSVVNLRNLENNAQDDVNNMTLAYIAKSQILNSLEDKDKDYDLSEFVDADVEEAEDRIYNEYKKFKQMGKPIAPETIQALAGDVNVDDLNQSIVMSARTGQIIPHTSNRANDTSNIDISALISDYENKSQRKLNLADIIEATQMSMGNSMKQPKSPLRGKKGGVGASNDGMFLFRSNRQRDLIEAIRQSQASFTPIQENKSPSHSSNVSASYDSQHFKKAAGPTLTKVDENDGNISIRSSLNRDPRISYQERDEQKASNGSNNIRDIFDQTSKELEAKSNFDKTQSAHQYDIAKSNDIDE